EREDVRDALVSNSYRSLDELPQGAKVGSSSLRRQCQIRALRPDLVLRDLRGNVNTRLRKLDEGEYDAIILAAAGLLRLGLGARIAQHLESTVSLPAVGQGAVGIECRSGDSRIQALIAPLNHTATSLTVSAERAMNSRLNGGCQVPIAGLAELRGDEIFLRGLVGEPAGGTLLRASASASSADAIALGERVADDLLGQGAADILAALSAKL